MTRLIETFHSLLKEVRQIALPDSVKRVVDWFERVVKEIEKREEDRSKTNA
jgi:hypothetical protein